MIALACVAALVLGDLSHARAAQSPALSAGEGALRNDAFQPVDEAARTEIARGDRHWQEASSGAGNAARTRAFDAWREALVVSAVGACVPGIDPEGGLAGLFPDPDHTRARRTESVVEAVLGRLESLPPEARSAWTARFEELAGAALKSGSHVPGLVERVERDHPATRAAARAALVLADQSLERLDLLATRTWLARARRHAPPEATALLEAIARREAAIPGKSAQPRSSRGSPQAWESAGQLVFETAQRLERRLSTARRADPPPPGRGVEAGLVTLRDDSWVIQTQTQVVRWERDSDDPTGARGHIGRFPLTELTPRSPARPFAAPSLGGWPLLPTSEGTDVVLVLGRAGLVHGNALIKIRFDARGLPVMRWRVDEQGVERFAGREAGKREAHEQLFAGGLWEFQPGPLAHGGRIFVCARSLARRLPRSEDTGSVDRVVLLCLDEENADLLWARDITRAADLRTDRGRFATVQGPPTPAQPIALFGTRIFCGTNVGVGTLLDALDGRLIWSLKSRRRLPEDDGWAGSRRAALGRATAGQASSAIIWAPFDSDRLYRLLPEPAAARGVLAVAPTPIGPAQDVVRGGGAELLLVREGARRSVWNAFDESRRTMLLERGEHFTGEALASERRLIVATNRRVYLFDRERELMLLDAEPLPETGAGRGGSIYGLGDRVVVVGSDTIWVLRVR